MESEQTGLALSLPLSTEHVCANSPVSVAYSELVDVVLRATEKLSIDWPDEPRESQSSKLDERFLSGPNSRPEWWNCHFSTPQHKYGRNLPCFDGVHLTELSSALKASVLQQELSSLLLKGAIEKVPQLDLKPGFFSRYFPVPKKDGGLWPILDLRRLNLSLYKGKFKMLTLKTIMS